MKKVQKKYSMLIEKKMKLKKKNRRGFLTCVILQQIMEVIDIIYYFVRDGS
jgi:hypothetical protein